MNYDTRIGEGEGGSLKGVVIIDYGLLVQCIEFGRPQSLWVSRTKSKGLVFTLGKKPKGGVWICVYKLENYCSYLPFLGGT